MGFENRILKKPILISSPLKHQRRTDAALQSNTHLRLRISPIFTSRVTLWWSTTMKQQFDEQVFDVNEPNPPRTFSAPVEKIMMDVVQICTMLGILDSRGGQIGNGTNNKDSGGCEFES
ncbi:hypothetical protein R6Q57_023180 [Mikania cordata]